MSVNKTAAAWKKAKTHTITLPSGFVVDIELPNLPLLLKSGQIPNGLVELVTKVQNDPSLVVTPEMMKEQYDFTRYIVAKTVVTPKVTEDDVDGLPAEDIEMIVDFALRNRDVDILGHHLAGLETQQDFRRFRGLGRGDEIDEGV